MGSEMSTAAVSRTILPIHSYSDTPSQVEKTDILRKIGKTLKQNNVRSLLFVHGTFVGTDHTSLFPEVNTAGFTQQLNQFLNTQVWKDHESTAADAVMNDVCNFSTGYVRELEVGLGIKCTRFLWSGLNCHRGRLDGTVELAKTLYTKILGFGVEEKKNPTILLVGHSHAGQLFALLTHFLENSVLGQTLLHHLSEYPHPQVTVEQVSTYVELIRTIHLDIVTLGTPIRYRWSTYEKYRLLPIINHRWNPDASPGHPEAVSVTGFMTARDGDYIQQYGSAGTDMARHVFHFVEDTRLSNILNDQGVNFVGLFSAVAFDSGVRRHPLYDHFTGDGHDSVSRVRDNFYVDYRDNERNTLKSFFGHGIYTTNIMMVFNMEIIAHEFYSYSIE